MLRWLTMSWLTSPRVLIGHCGGHRCQPAAATAARSRIKWGLLTTFYFPQRAGLLLLAAALTFSYAGRPGRRRQQRQGANAAFWS